MSRERYEGGWLRAAEEAARLVSLMLWPFGRRAERFYAFLSTHNLLAEETLFMNLGYWADPTVQTLDEAARALAGLLGEAARLQPGDDVLDVGFGLGDQDLYWAERFRPGWLAGLNIVPRQVEVARERVRGPDCPARWSAGGLGHRHALP